MGLPRKVLMTADAVGGVWTYALDLTRGLRERGIDVALAVLGPPLSAEQRRSADQVAALGVIETGLSLDWTADGPIEVAASGVAVAALARQLDVDLVHLNSPALAADQAFDQPVVAICHSCVATWWNAVRGGELPDGFAWRTKMVRNGYEAADALVAPSAAFAQATTAIYELGRELSVVHNGRPMRSSGARTSLDAPAELFVLTAGRLWDEGKNAAVLDRVAGQLAAPVLAAGATSGPNGAAIALEHVRALGQVDTDVLDGLFAARPVFVSLACYEPFGLAVLEAAQAGCPLVLSDIPTFRELWNGAAAFVSSTDESGAVALLGRLLSDPAERERLGRAARARSLRYTLDRMTEGVIEVYRTTMAARETSRPAAAPARSAA